MYLTLGTVVGRTDNLTPAIQALGRLDADVLLALGSAAGGRLESIPDNVRVEAFVDQAAVLPHADPSCTTAAPAPCSARWRTAGASSCSPRGPTVLQR